MSVRLGELRTEIEAGYEAVHAHQAQAAGINYPEVTWQA